jgi:hypothetical protein
MTGRNLLPVTSYNCAFRSDQNSAPAQRLYCPCKRFLFVLGSTTLSWLWSSNPSGRRFLGSITNSRFDSR